MSAEEYIYRIAGDKHPDRLILAGAIGRLSVDPPQKFYASMVARATIRQMTSNVATRLVEGLSGVGMIERTDDVAHQTPAKVYARADVPEWGLVEEIIADFSTESEIHIPELVFAQADTDSIVPRMAS